jgi:hypothetical protein
MMAASGAAGETIGSLVGLEPETLQFRCSPVTN